MPNFYMVPNNGSDPSVQARSVPNFKLYVHSIGFCHDKSQEYSLNTKYLAKDYNPDKRATTHKTNQFLLIPANSLHFKQHRRSAIIQVNNENEE